MSLDKGIGNSSIECKCTYHFTCGYCLQQTVARNNLDNARLYNQALTAIEMLEIKRAGQLQYVPEVLTLNPEFSSYHKENANNVNATESI